MMISYSGNNEDVMLVRALQHLKTGTYIDVGAHTPVDGSNTYALYVWGWKGIACDPLFNFEPAWVAQWGALRPRDIVVRDAIGAAPGETEFWMCNVRGLSTCNRGWAEGHLKANGNGRSLEQGSKVGVVTLDRVIDKLLDGKAPELICIDVEGQEGEVLRGIDLTRYRPWLFCIEAYCIAEGLAPHYAAWEPILDRAGYYCVWDDRLNRFYLADERKQEIRHHFVYPPNCTDGIMPLRQYELQRRVEEYEQTRAKLFTVTT